MAVYFQKFELPLENAWTKKDTQRINAQEKSRQGEGIQGKDIQEKSIQGKDMQDKDAQEKDTQEKDTPGKSKHEREHYAGRKLLKESLFREFREEFCCPEEEFCLEDELAKEALGKPFLKRYPQIYFNISHGKDMVVCGVGKASLGVDVEAVRPVKQNLFRRVLTEREQDWLKKRMEEAGKEGWYRDFFRIWTLKESYAKAVGKGLAVDFTSLEFALPVWDKTYYGKGSQSEFLGELYRENAEQLWLFPGKNEEKKRRENAEYCKAFLMEEVLCCRLEEEGSTKNLWRFFQTIVDQEYVVSCCIRR